MYKRILVSTEATELSARALAHMILMGSQKFS